MPIVISRPRWSETQPKKGRARPFITLSTTSATLRAVAPNRMATLATPKSLAISASCAVAIRPVAASSTNMKYISQKMGERSISAPVKLRALWLRRLATAAGAASTFLGTVIEPPLSPPRAACIWAPCPLLPLPSKPPLALPPA